MRISKKKLLAGIIVLSLVGAAFATVPLLAADTATVNATVTPKLVSVAVDVPSVAYGTVAVGEVNVAPSPDSVIKATNDGSVTEEFLIRGANATYDLNTWTLVTTAPAADAYNHKYGLWTGTLGALVLLTTSNVSMATGVAPLGFKEFKLRISTPTSTSAYGQYSTSVTLVATG